MGKELVVFGVVDEGELLVGSSFIDLAAQSSARVTFEVPFGGRVVGLAFDRTALVGRAPRLDESRMAEMSFAHRGLFDANCAEGTLMPDERTARISWPADATPFRFDFEGSKVQPVSGEEDWFADRSLSVPIEPQRCNGHSEIRVRAFAPNMPFLAAGIVVGGVPLLSSELDLKEFVRVDEQRLLIAQGPLVMLVERDVGFIDAPERFMRAAPDWKFSSVTAGPADPDTGLIRVVGLETYAAGNAVGNVRSSRLVEATLDGARLIRGATHFETDTLLRTLYLQPKNGRLLVFESPSTMFEEQTPGGDIGRVASLQDMPTAADKRGRLTATALADHPVALVGSQQSSIYLSSADNRVWQNLNTGLTPGITHRAFAQIESADASPLLFAGNTTGDAFRRRLDDTTWRPFEVRLDASLIGLGCAVVDLTNSCGFSAPKVGWQSFTPFVDDRGAPALLAFTERCPAAFVISNDGCASHWLSKALSQAQLDRTDEFTAIRSEAGYVTLATDEGRLYEIPWSELGLN